MRALIVYESMFGNTREVALAIAEGVRGHMAVEAVEVAEAPAEIPAAVALLIVGGPTHAHGMTTPKSRADSLERAGDRLISRGSGVREWVARLQPTATPITAAAFDTRIKGPALLWGSAAKSVSKRLRELGFRLEGSSESFLVSGPSGPLFDRLVDGEIERAREWGASMAKAPAAAAR